MIASLRLNGWLASLITAGMATMATLVPLTAYSYELTIPILDYRTGPYAPNGIPLGNGIKDYLTLLNERDGGINGALINPVSCETGYNTAKGVECYESVKNVGESGALVISPFSTGITYQLIPKASKDEIPILSMGYGRTSAADGRVFPWVFNFPTTYWSQATAFISYIAQKEGGLDDLKGKKIALIYHNSAYGKEPITVLKVLAEKYGYDLTLYPVDHPGQEQKSTWLQIRRSQPDWILMWGWGVMNQVAIKEASSIRFPMNRFIGVWWSGSENDVQPSGDGAHGYLSGTFHAPGDDFPLHDEIRKYVYDRGLGAGDPDRIGEVLYNRGLIDSIYRTEAIRNAMRIHDTNEVNGKMVRDGLESLSIDEERFTELGLPNFAQPIAISCLDHESGGAVAIQQWDAKTKKWRIITPEWIPPMIDVVRPMIEADAAQYAAENGIVPREC